MGDINREYYRPKQEELEWKSQRDPIQLHGARLMEEGLAEEAALEAIREEALNEMKAAVEFAVATSYPGPEEVEMHVYA